MPSCQPHCVWISISPGLLLQTSPIPAPESESRVCLCHAEVALDCWRNQSVHCTVSDLHAQQTLSVHHSGSADRQEKRNKSIKGPPFDMHLSFSKDTSHNAPNPTSMTTKQLQKHHCLLCYPWQHMFRKDKLRTQTQKRMGWVTAVSEMSHPPLRAGISPERDAR